MAGVVVVVVELDEVVVEPAGVVVELEGVVGGTVVVVVLPAIWSARWTAA